MVFAFTSFFFYDILKAETNEVSAMGKKSQLENARELRKNMTKEEGLLWHRFLKTYPVRFCRQVPIEGYIVDFCCRTCRLVIELDGSQHYEPDEQKNDAVRTAVLEKRGYTVLRFSNLDVLQRFDGVCQAIDEKVQTLKAASF